MKITTGNEDLDMALDAMARVSALHSPSITTESHWFPICQSDDCKGCAPSEIVCTECEKDYPCNTIKALYGEQS